MASSVMSTSSKTRGTRSRRERPHIALAPGQPPTTQGKPRTRVFVACLQCRRRKIRCDGAKPICHNCSQRASGDECCYDTAPKRRGPDRVQGARTRGAREYEDTGELGRLRRRRARTPPPAPELELSSASMGSLRPLSPSAFEPPPIRGDIYIPSLPHAVPEASLAAHTTPIELDYARSTSDVPNSPSLDPYSPVPHPQSQSQSQDPFAHITDYDSHPLVGASESNAQFASASAYDFQVTPSPYVLHENNFMRSPEYTQWLDAPSLPLIETQTRVVVPAVSSQRDLYHAPVVRPACINPEECCSDEDATILVEPSVDFARRTWWDHLLTLYCSASPGAPITSVTRDTAAREVFRDIKYLFQTTSFHFSFFHARRFHSSLADSRHRSNMQSSLVLAALATSKLTQSSIYGLGDFGMRKALLLRNEAQAALDASLSTSAINEELAQAAWILAFFEQCCHPESSRSRVRSSLHLLDTIIRALALTHIDDGSPQASAYEPHTVPTVSTSPVPRSSNVLDAHPAYGVSPIGVRGSYPNSTSAAWPMASTPSNHHLSHPVVYASAAVNSGMTSPAQHELHSPPHKPCGCDALSLGNVDPTAQELTPMWANQPAWQDEWNESEIRRESCRRLVWMSVTLLAGYTSYAAAIGHPPLECSIIEPANHCLLLPGETLGSGKGSVWALYVRAMLLWHSCLSPRDYPDPDFAMRAWHESEAIESALNEHTCNVERALLYHGREFLFNTRMSISFDFQQFIPHVLTDVSRGKAREWLRIQGHRAKIAAKALGDITGHGPKHTIVQRPSFVWWFMGQVQRALKLWAQDKSLTIALEVCGNFMAPIEFLGLAYPCAEQYAKYQEIKVALDAARAEAQASGWMPSE